MNTRMHAAALLAGFCLACALTAGCSRERASPPQGASASAENAASPARRRERLLIGFSQVNHANPWRIAETNDIRSEAAGRGHELVLLDSGSSAAQQVRDVAALIARRVDYIILAPKEFSALRPAILAARDAGIPLILADRMADAEPGKDFLAFVGSDFIPEGEWVAAWLAARTGGKARIVELRGEKGSSPEIDRAEGFRREIAKHPGMRIVASRYAHFERLEGQKIMEEIILSLGRGFDAVFAHNDEMAIGAIQALKAAGIRPGVDVLLGSIDGGRDALKAIIAGELGVSVECSPRIARPIFDLIDAHHRGETVPPRVLNVDRLFDATNAARFISSAF
jgi:ribose transport system substrate-binding protein